MESISYEKQRHTQGEENKNQKKIQTESFHDAELAHDKGPFPAPWGWMDFRIVTGQLLLCAICSPLFN